MDGIIIINKPKNCTSHDIVYKIKKIVKEKTGHTGTLDPLATGVLPILIGKGTQTSKYLVNHDKIYKVKIQLGQKTDTADEEGEIIQEQKVKQDILNKEFIIDILNTFKGKQEQIPPIYSAIKVNGKKLYEYARKGEKVELKPRNIEIYDIKLLNINKEQNQIELEVSCSKGTYIRSLCEDIAEKLGTIGYMKELERLKVGEFSIKEAITIEQIIQNENIIKEKIIKIEDLFKQKNIITLDNRKLQLFLNGVKLTNKNKDDIYRIYYKNNFIGIGIIENNLLKRDIIIKEM